MAGRDTGQDERLLPGQVTQGSPLNNPPQGSNLRQERPMRNNRDGAVMRHESAPAQNRPRPVTVSDESARVHSDPVILDKVRKHDQQELDESLHINTKAQEFLKAHRIHSKISDAIHNRGHYRKEFVSPRVLCDIWRHLLARFLGIVVPIITEDDIHFIWKHLLSIISVLVKIDWNEWHRFHTLFIERMRDPNRQRLDKHIPFEHKDLCDTAFLGLRGEAFWNSQYLFYPILIAEGETAEYPRWQPLPFLHEESEKLGEGSYGAVWKEAIAPHQYWPKDHDSPRASKVQVARKLMIAPGDFRKEKNNLLKLNSTLSTHEHIIRYLAIIIVGEPNESKDFSILMPLATMNLKDFLETDPSLVPQFELKHFLHQAANIAHAMQWLHNGLPIDGRVYIVCHMDLTPVNILVFLDQATTKEPVGKWKIADFGISSLQEKEIEERAVPRQRSSSLVVKSPANSLAQLTARTARMDAGRPAGAFQAPEVDTRKSVVGRASDVWSFGCNLFQILARGVGPGTETLQKLDHLRTREEDGTRPHETDYFYREREGKKVLNPHVKNWLEQPLVNGSDQARYLVPCCKELISRMLHVESDRRPSAHEVNNSLWQMIIPIEELQSPINLQKQQSLFLSAQPAVSVPQISVTPAPQPRASPPPPAALAAPKVPPAATVSPPPAAPAPLPPEESTDPPRHSPHDAPQKLTATITDVNDDLWHIPAWSDKIEEVVEEPSQSVQGHSMGSPALPNSEPHVRQMAAVNRPTDQPGASAGPTPRDIPRASADPTPRDIQRAWTLQEPFTFAPSSRFARGNSDLPNPATHTRQMTAVNRNIDQARASVVPGPGILPRASTSRDFQTIYPTPTQTFPRTPFQRPHHRTSDASQSSGQSQPRLSVSSSSTSHSLFELTPPLSAVRNPSNASSLASLVSVETVQYDSAAFASVSNVIKSLISTSGNMAFITKKTIRIRDMKATQFCSIKTNNFEWEGGSMAGDYLTAVGMTNSKQAYRLYQLASNGVLVNPISHRVLSSGEDIIKVVVSPQRDLLIQRRIDSNNHLPPTPSVQLYSDSNGDLRTLIQDYPGSPPDKGSPQDIQFGGDGRHAFVKVAYGSNLYHIKVWQVSDLRCFEYQYWRTMAGSAKTPILIPFPSSPTCILWDEHDKLWFLRKPETATFNQVFIAPSEPTTQIQRHILQAVAISPDEQYVVFIVGINGFQKKSEIHVSSLSVENGLYQVGTKLSPARILNKALSHPKGSAVSVQMMLVSRILKVLIAHSNGTFEEQDIFVG